MHGLLVPLVSEQLPDMDDWAQPCQLFLFRIDHQSLHVVVDLKGDGLDVRLSVFEGRVSDRAVRMVGSNDDNQESSATRNSRLRMDMGNGRYIVRAELKDRSQATSGKGEVAAMLVLITILGLAAFVGLVLSVTSAVLTMASPGRFRTLGTAGGIVVCYDGRNA